MGMYILADGQLVDTATARLLWRPEDIDGGLVRFSDGRQVLFIWEADLAYEVPSEAAAEDLLHDYREGKLTRGIDYGNGIDYEDGNAADHG